MAFTASSLIPAAFPALALAHFMALISPGPDFFLVLGHSARKNLRDSVWLCLGIALGNAAYIALASAGFSLLQTSASFYRMLELAGAAYLVWLGIALVRASRRPAPQTLLAHTPLLPARQLATGLFSALLNPKNAIFYLTLMTVFLGPSATPAQLVFAGAWMTCVVLFWDLGLAALLTRPRFRARLAEAMPAVERASGVILVILALALVCRG